MPNPRNNQIDRDALDQDEIRAIRRHLEPEHWRILFDLLAVTGLRITEALTFRRSDFVYARGSGDVVFLSIKRLKKKRDNRPDQVPVPPTLGNQIRDRTPPQYMALAFAKPGAPFTPYTKQAAWKAVRRAAKRARVRIDGNGESSVHPHLYRHSLGVALAQADLGLSELNQRTMVSAALGHANLRTSETYFRQSGRQVVETWRDVQAEIMEELD